MKKLSVEQHQMLEDLTGLQHTQNGTVRKKQNRSRNETVRLGLRDTDPPFDLKSLIMKNKSTQWAVIRTPVSAGPNLLRKLLGSQI